MRISFIPSKHVVFEVHHLCPQCHLALDNREAKLDCFQVNSEFVLSQWQIWRYPNLSEQSLHRGNLELCATSIDSCASRHPQTSLRPKLAQKYVFFLLAIQPRSINLQVMQLIRFCQVSFPFSAFKAKGSTVDQSWIEICHLLQVRTETSIEANQFHTVYTMRFLFFGTSKMFVFPPGYTHIINHLVKHTHAHTHTHTT